MKILYFIFILTFTLTFQAQSGFNSKDYTVTLSDLETNIFEKDSTANALVIYEHGNSYIDDKAYKLVSNFKRKLKIINSNGFDKATVSIYLYYLSSHSLRQVLN